ncbi:hypothetical protein TNCT_174611 [Trichonephila clavata]|uniref:SH3 domain-containing protein n=1 Tax=Trichonephila clavata TaxID=2740835 RepID=A0A8X6F1J5_TRICU|nr:hypothetical protein TNCT_174611 [Trichonephila clavata]
MEERINGLINKFLPHKDVIKEMHETFTEYMLSLKTLHYSRLKVLNVISKDYDNDWEGKEEFCGGLETAMTNMDKFIKYMVEDFIDHLHWCLVLYDATMDRFEQWRTVSSEVECVREKLYVLESMQNRDEATIQIYKDDEFSLSKINFGLAIALQQEILCHLNSWDYFFSMWISDFFNEEVSFYKTHNSVLTDWRNITDRLYKSTSCSNYNQPIASFRRFYNQRIDGSFTSLEASTAQITDDFETEDSSNIFPEAFIRNEEASTAPNSLNVEDEVRAISVSLNTEDEVPAISVSLNTEDEVPTSSNALNLKDEVPAVSDASDKDVPINIEEETNMVSNILYPKDASNICSESASGTTDLPVPSKRLKEETIVEEKEEDESIPILYQVQALIPYTAETEEELSFNRYDIIDIIDDSDIQNGRALGICNGKEGIVPMYCTYQMPP